jgi:hypothetical protein
LPRHVLARIAGRVGHVRALDPLSRIGGGVRIPAKRVWSCRTRLRMVEPELVARRVELELRGRSAVNSERRLLNATQNLFKPHRRQTAIAKPDEAPAATPTQPNSDQERRSPTAVISSRIYPTTTAARACAADDRFLAHRMSDRTIRNGDEARARELALVEARDRRRLQPIESDTSPRPRISAAAQRARPRRWWTKDPERIRSPGSRHSPNWSSTSAAVLTWIRAVSACSEPRDHARETAR